jgi:hypothetical protein
MQVLNCLTWLLWRFSISVMPIPPSFFNNRNLTEPDILWYMKHFVVVVVVLRTIVIILFYSPPLTLSFQLAELCWNVMYSHTVEFCILQNICKFIFEIHIKSIISVLVLFQALLFSVPFITFICLTINMILHILFFPTPLRAKHNQTKSSNAEFLTANFIRTTTV